MNVKVLAFNDYVRNQAKDLLDEIKSGAATYGNVKEKLLTHEKSVKWSDPHNHYLMVIAEAKQQLEKEIDATKLA